MGRKIEEGSEEGQARGICSFAPRFPSSYSCLALEGNPLSMAARARGAATSGPVLAALTDHIREATDFGGYTEQLEDPVDSDLIVQHADLVIALRKAIKPATNLNQAFSVPHPSSSYLR